MHTTGDVVDISIYSLTIIITGMPFVRLSIMLYLQHSEA